MKALGYALAALACWLLRLAGRGFITLTRLVLLLALPVASWWLRRVRGRKPVAVARQQVEAAAEAPFAAAQVLPAPATSTHAGSGGPPAVADRIVSLRLDPPVGVIHLRLYQAQRLVRSELIVLEPCLRSLLRGRRHPLPELQYDPVDGLEAIKDRAVEAAEAFINARGNAGRLRPTRRAGAPATPPRAAPPTATARAAGANPPEPAPDRAAAAVPVPARPAAAIVVPQASTGVCYVGTLVQAGTTTVRPDGRAPYDIFEATLRLDNGAELALRGAELQRELATCHCSLGQRIAVTPMGKVPVPLANGGEGHKNLYRVQLADRWPAGASA